MGHFIFLFFAVFSVLCALGMVFARNAVNAAMCLLLCLAGVAGLFVQLEAYLLAFLLILVYAGAVVALFLFIVMLLDIRGQDRPARGRVGFGAAIIAGALLIAGVVSLVAHGRADLPNVPPVPGIGSSLANYANLLFTTYLLPVQVIGFLLLIAMLGVIVLSRRQDADPERKSVTE